MNLKMIARFLGRLSLMECAFLLIPLCITLFDGDDAGKFGFLSAIAILAVIGGSFSLLGRDANQRFYAREGYLLVGLAWILVSLGGALPFWLSGQTPNFFDAFFESVSGFTTTGATILPNVEIVGRGLLLWRSLSNWLGGMGILVFLLAVANSEKGTGYNMHVLRAESPGPVVEKVVPRTRSHARTMYGIYIALTALLLIILLILDMPLFDAINCALATAGTGGFGIKADSILSYRPAIVATVGIFMFLFGINFNVHLLSITGRLRYALKDEELRAFTGITFGAIALIMLQVSHTFASFGQALLHTGFTVSSFITSTGFSTVNFDQWPAFSKGVLLLVMLVGACAGSTGGGIKVSRILIAVKALRRSLKKMLHPRAVQLVRINGKVIDEDTVDTTFMFLICYALIALLACLIVSLNDFSMETTISAVVSCLSNIGPGFGSASQGFGGFSNVSKLVLSGCMLLGRLEIFPYLVFLDRNAWNRAR